MFFFFNDTATTEIYTLSLHDALPICFSAEGDESARRHAVASCRAKALKPVRSGFIRRRVRGAEFRSEEHTSELQSPCNLVCRLLLEKKKKKYNRQSAITLRNLT